MKIGFLGGGNMGSALMQGILKAQSPMFEAVMAYDPSPASRARLDKMGVKTMDSARAMCTECDMIVLAVKPQILEAAIRPCQSVLGGKFIVSIAAGWTIERLKSKLPTNIHLLRVMPNTPALVGCGMTALCETDELSDTERAAAEALFGCVGEYIWLDEHYIDAVTGVSGSGPAYVYMFMDALALGGVRMGLPRDVAMKLAAQTVKGAAEMALSTGAHPDALRDAVCSPAGTTIEAVRLLEQRGLRPAVMDAVICCAEKSRDMAAGK